MAIYHQPLLPSILPISDNLNSSSAFFSSTVIAASDASNFLSITTYTKKAIRPIQSPISAINSGRETSITPVALAMGTEKPNASAVPILAMATCIPMAVASSFPLNHLTMIFETVMPATSTPTAKVAKPMLAQNTCASSPKSVCPRNVPSETAQYLIAAPATITAAAPTPVMRTPSLSRMIPPKISISRKTLNQP